MSTPKRRTPCAGQPRFESAGQYVSHTTPTNGARSKVLRFVVVALPAGLKNPQILITPPQTPPIIGGKPHIMPGIAGVISQRPPDECRRLVDEMIGCMQHEAFYTAGSYSAPDLGIFSGWVALKDSFADCQPILNAQGDVALLFSGECFADPDARNFEPHSAAWLIHLYEERGDRFFADLNGVFSGLLIDRRQRRAFLFNDRYGMDRTSTITKGKTASSSPARPRHCFGSFPNCGSSTTKASPIF